MAKPKEAALATKGNHMLSPVEYLQGQAQRDDAAFSDFDKKSIAVQDGTDRKRSDVLAVWKRFCSSFPRLRRVLLEFRNFRNRTRIVWNNNDSYRCPSSFAFLEAPSGRVYENIRSNGRIECIRTCVSKNPWATPLDWKLCSDAWDQGLEWALNNLDFDSPSTSEHKAMLKSELSYKGPRSNGSDKSITSVHKEKRRKRKN